MLHEGPGGRKAGEWTSSVKTAMMILNNDLRRTAISCLRETPNQTITTENLADKIRDRKDNQLEQTKLMVRLHHVHLPKLAEAGLIEFDPRSGLIRYLSDEDTERLLDRLDEWKSDSNQ